MTREQAMARAFLLVIHGERRIVPVHVVWYSVHTAVTAYRALAARSTHVAERSEGDKQP